MFKLLVLTVCLASAYSMPQQVTDGYLACAYSMPEHLLSWLQLVIWLLPTSCHFSEHLVVLVTTGNLASTYSMPQHLTSCCLGNSW